MQERAFLTKAVSHKSKTGLFICILQQRGVPMIGLLYVNVYLLSKTSQNLNYYLTIVKLIEDRDPG